MTLREQINTYVIIWELGRLLCGDIPRCEICFKVCRTPKKGFVIHHFNYRKKEKMYKDFQQGKKSLSTKQRLSYYTYLAPFVKQYKKQFAFLCVPCHFSLEKAVRFGDQKWKMLNKYRAKTRRYTKPDKKL